MADASTDWESVKLILADAMELPSDAREDFVRARCKGDGPLLTEILGLMNAYDETDGVLGSNADAWLGYRGPDVLGMSGRRIGRYTLERLIAEGGMGAVYVAQQQSPDRRVAVKLLRTTLPMLDTAYRFRREAAALGRLQHPNIAQIYESGVHDAGLPSATPFLAMELVDGEPLNQYVVNKKLSRDDRIRLMIKVAGAVQAAHQQAVIHRDLKPANVLVQGNGEPKVLDFGIARLADMEETNTTWQTTVGVLLGTPAYMSPEQATGDANKVDVRSDVWSLGVMLYEMLTERLPLDVKGRPPLDILRTIETTDPKPIGQIDSSLRGDLETIVTKAMAKDKTQRYASAEALANDLRNVLDYQPITARAPSRWYRAKKFAGRNRLAVTLTALLLLTSVGAAIFSTTSLLQARRQRDRAEAVNTFLNDVVSRANPNTGGKDLTMREVMAQAEQRVSQDFAKQPTVEAELRRTIGWAYFNMSDFPAAERNLARSIELFRQTVGDGDIQTLRSSTFMVSVLRMVSRNEEALKLVDTTLATGAKSLGRDHPFLLEVEISRAALHTEMSNNALAAETYKELIPRLRRVFGENNEQVLLAENNYGYMLVSAARHAEAEPVLEDVLRRGIALRGADHPELFPTRSNLMTAKTGLGKLEESEAGYRALCADTRRVLGEDHRRSTANDSELSQVLSLLGKHDESIELQKTVVERSRRTVGVDHPMTFKWEMFLVNRMLQGSRYAEAEAATREFLPRARRVLGEEFLTTLLLEDNLARAISGQKRFAEAEPIFRSVIPRTQKLVGDRNNWYANARLNFARCLNGLGKHDEAMENLAESQRISESMNLVSVAPSVRREMAQTYQLMGRADEAERVLLDAIEKDSKLANRKQLERTTSALAELYDRMNKPDEAVRWRATTQPTTAPSAAPAGKQ